MDFHSVTLITSLLLVFVSAIIGGLVARLLRQPMILGYIGAGVLFGNIVPHLANQQILQLIADMGVTLLLFTLGVEFSFYRLRRVLGTIAWAAAVQILSVLLVFFLLFLWFGFTFLPALFIAAAVSLSSTAIAVKVLSEKGEADSLPSDVSYGWLIIQDLAVVPLMIILPTLARLSGSSSVTFLSTTGLLAGSLAKAVMALAVIVILGHWGVPKLLSRVATLASREIFLLTTVGLVFLSAVATYAVGLSAALGAFIAGLLVAETSQNHAIFAEIRPLRDLFAVIFFVTLGLLLPVGSVIGRFGLLIGFTALVLFMKWFIVLGLARYVGYHRKTAFLIALTLLPMSEFGFILAKEGVSLGVLSQEHSVFLVALTFFTMIAGTPLISRDHEVYYWFYRTLGKRWPKIFPVKIDETSLPEQMPLSNHVVICGYGRVGKYIGRALVMANIPFLVVDYNHTAAHELRSKGIAVVYGDPADKDVLDFAQVDFAKVIIIAIPDKHTQEMVITNALMLNKRIRIFCRTHHEEDQPYLKSLGVHTIIQPEFEAALSVVEKLFSEFGVAPDEIPGKISRLKIEHGLG